MYNLSVYVPRTHLDAVREALFSAGAGAIGAYDRCCWVTEGTGQFRPLAGSDAFIGSVGEDTFVREYKLEITMEDSVLEKAVEALLKAHPYETPAYGFYRFDSPFGMK